MLPSRTHPAGARLRRSTAALAHPLSASAWRGALVIRRSDPTVAVALRVGLATMLALVGGSLLGSPQVAGFAALGALCAAFVRYEPYPRLVAKLLCVGVAVVVYTAFGAVLGVSGLSIGSQIGLLSVAAGVSYWLLTAFRITGPGPVILIFAAAGAAGYADTAAEVGIAAAAVAAGAALGVGIAVAPMLHHPHGPARIAVARALTAAAELETGGENAVPAAHAAIVRAREVIALGFRGRPDRHTRQLLALVAAAERAVDDGRRDPDRSADLAVWAARLRSVRRSLDLPDPPDISGAIVLSRPESFVREGVRRLQDRDVVAGAGRVAVASLLAGGLAAAVGLAHPLWATMGAMAALQGATYRDTVQRGIQRLLGNVVGALLAAGLLVFDPGHWQLVAVIVLCQTVTELVVSRNYGIATVFVTAMALLLTAIAEPLGPGVAVSRVADTLVGVVVGVVVAAVTLHHGDRHHLA